MRSWARSLGSVLRPPPIDISENGGREAVEKVYNRKARYRLTLVGYDKVFEKRN